MAAPTLETDGTTLRITDGTSGDPVTFNDVWDWDDGGGSSGGNGDVPVDGGGTEKVSAYMTEHIADAVYQILKNIQAGNGATSSFFRSLNEMIYVDAGVTWKNTIGATFQLGQLLNGHGSHGSMLSWEAANNYIASGGTLNVYGSVLHLRNNLRDYIGGSAVVNLSNSTIRQGTLVLATGAGAVTWDRVTLDDMERVEVLRTLTASALFVSDADIRINSVSTSINEFQLVNASWSVQGTNITGTLVDPIGTVPPPVLQATCKGVVHHTVNIHVNDQDGADLAGVAITATSYGNIVSPSGTGTPFYRCIVGHKAGTWATDLAAGKWELTSNANAALAGVTGLSAATGAWVTLVDYAAAAATEISAVETDANGDIAEDYLTYRKWTGLSEAMLSYAPYTFALSRTNYETLTMENIVPTAAIVWSLELQDEAPTRYDVEKETTNITANGVPVAVTKFDLTTISE